MGAQVSRYTKRVQTVLTEEQYAALSQLALERDKPLSVLIREAIEQRNWTEATQQIDIAAHAIEDFASKLDRVRISPPGTVR